MEKVLLFFSGGNDSTLSAIKLAMQGYEVYLITFDNGREEGIENIRNRATTLENMFKHSKTGEVHNLGVFQSASEFMLLRYKTVNEPIADILSKYGNLNQNQLNCLTCRSAMYVVGIAVAKELGIKYIAEGARQTQMFALEQQEILDSYQNILTQYDMQLLLPVYDYKSDKDVELELWDYSNNFYQRIHEDTTHYEAKCWLGIPMDKPLTDEEIIGYKKYFEDNLQETIIANINSYPKYPIKEQLQNPTYTKIKFK